MAPNKTLYIREPDMPVWEQAEKQATATGQSVSQLATQALRTLLAAIKDDFPVVILGPDELGQALEGTGGHLKYERQDRGIHAWRLHYLDANGDVDDEILGVGLREDEADRAVEEARSFLRDRSLGEMEKITVDTGDDYDLTEGFTGRWLIAPDSDETRTGEPNWDAGMYWGVALTKRGNIAVYSAHCNQRQAGALRAYKSIEQASPDVPADILARAAAELGEKRVVWRDI